MAGCALASFLRVALVLERFDPTLGGLEGWTADYARWLAGRGHAVTIVCTAGVTPSPGVELALAAPAASPLALAESLAARLAGLAVDLVHDTGCGHSADIFQPQTGSRLVNSDRDLAARPWRPWLRAWASAGFRRWRREMAVLERRQFQDPSRIIAVSALVRDSIARRYRLLPERMRVIHNGVDTAAFTPANIAGRRAGARAQWGLEGATVFLLVANNFGLKGLGTALHALALLQARLPGAVLAVAGAGDPARYQALAARLGVADRLRLLGRVPDILDAYAAADVALQPTHYDACSLATLEGLACGLPTITTASNGAGELITDGKEGLVLPDSHDPRALATAMLRLAAPACRAMMAAAARKLAEAHDLAANHAQVEAFAMERLAVKRRAA